MELSLAKRLPLLPNIFEFPERVWVQDELVQVLTELNYRDLGVIDGSVFSRMLSGRTKDRLHYCNQRTNVIAAIVAHIDKKLGKSSLDFWKAHQTSADELAEYLGRSPADFLQYLVKVSRREPRGSEALRGVADQELSFLPSLENIPARDTETLFKRLGGRCFFYRLGEQRRSQKGKVGRLSTEIVVPMLRRIPVTISRGRENYLLYSDKYNFYEANGGEDWATGRVFYMREHFTVLAEDYDQKGISELFLIQLKDSPTTMKGGHAYEGLLLMNGDLHVPTACKVIFRRAPASLQEIPWEDFVSEYELAVELKMLQDGNIEVARGEKSEAIFGEIPFSDYISKLQIEGTTVDISLK